MSDELNAVEPQSSSEPLETEKPSIDVERLAQDLLKAQQENGRLASELEKVRKEAADRRVKNKELAPKAEKATELEARLAEIEAQLKAAQEKARASELHTLRLTAISKHGLTADDLEFLTGETAETLEAQAKKLAERIKSAASKPAVGAGNSPENPLSWLNRQGTFGQGGWVINNKTGE